MLKILTLICIVAFLFLLSCVWRNSAGPKRVDAGPFTIELPPRWKFHKLQGTDSLVGEFEGDNIKLRFDYGLYSSPLIMENNNEHIISFELVDGRKAQFITPKVVGKGVTGIYFNDVDNITLKPRITDGSKGKISLEFQTKLEIHGRNLTNAQQEEVYSIFHSIQFK